MSTEKQMFRKEIDRIDRLDTLYKFINRYSENMNSHAWYLVTKKKFIDDNFMEQHRDHLDWDYICVFRNLSSVQARKYYRYMDPYEFSRYQYPGVKFIWENIEDLNPEALIKNIKVPDEDREKLREIIRDASLEQLEKWELQRVSAPITGNGGVVRRTFKAKKEPQFKISIEDLNKYTKDDLKMVLDLNEVKYRYKDTLADLKQKLLSQEKLSFGKFSKDELKRILDLHEAKYLYKNKISELLTKVNTIYNIKENVDE